MNLKSTTSSISDFFYARPKLKYYLPQALTMYLFSVIFHTTHKSIWTIEGLTLVYAF